MAAFEPVSDGSITGARFALAPIPLLESFHSFEMRVRGLSSPHRSGELITLSFGVAYFICLHRFGGFVYDLRSDSWTLAFKFSAPVRGLSLRGFCLGAYGYGGGVVVGSSLRSSVSLSMLSAASPLRALSTLSFRVQCITRAIGGYFILDFWDKLLFYPDGGACELVSSCPYHSDVDPVMAFLPCFPVVVLAGSYGLAAYFPDPGLSTAVAGRGPGTWLSVSVPSYCSRFTVGAHPSLCILSCARLAFKPSYDCGKLFVLCVRRESVWPCSLSSVSFDIGGIVSTGGLSPDLVTSVLSSCPSICNDILILLCTFLDDECVHCLSPSHHYAAYVCSL